MATIEQIEKLKEERAKKMKEETGITDQAAALYLKTFAEIEIDLHVDRLIGEASTPSELAALEIQRAGARATLLLAAQMKRVADMFGRYLDDLDAEAERQEIRNLFK